MAGKRCRTDDRDQCYNLCDEHDPHVSYQVMLLRKFTCLARWYLVDRWGRRFILLSGAVIVCYISRLASSSFLTLCNVDGHCTRFYRMVDVY